MIVRSKIRQSFRSPFGFVLEVGDNKFDGPLPDAVAQIFEFFRKRGVIEFLPDPPADGLTPLPEIVEQGSDPIEPAVVHAPAPASAPRPGPKKARNRKR